MNIIKYVDKTPSYEEYKKRVNDWKKQTISKQIPKKLMPEFVSYVTLPYHDIANNPFSLREFYIMNVGYVLLTEEWIKPFANWLGERPCLEIMAGSGSLSYTLRNYGVNIHPTDNFSWSKSFRPWCEVENIDCIDAIEKYGREVKFIICSWPYMDDTAYRVLLKMREVNPNCRLIYIGESQGGCTANDLFFDNIQGLNLKTFNAAVANYKSWYSIYDSISLIK